jgi:5-(carboxyamino)imidazole ribonucleotide synthase
MTPILPGATIGFLGGGQLGRMTAMAARSLGYNVVVLDPDPACPARSVADRVITARFDDDDAFVEIAELSDVVTLEIEKVSVRGLAAAAKITPVRPGAEVLEIVQDRARQKEWLARVGVPLGPYRRAASAEELAAAVRELGPSFVKTCHGGYDGRGQMRVESAAEASTAWTMLGSGPVVVEQALDLAAELSVMVARRPAGDVAVYPPALNHHEERILDWSVIPGPFQPDIAERATNIARHIASQMALEGLLAIELFLLHDGQLLVNELAPRPHNTFHATELACVTSQFEQAVRAVCDLPLGSPETLRPAAIVNLLGDLWLSGVPAFDAALRVPGVRLTLYGKQVARPGRKMGHLSAVGETQEEAVGRVLDAEAALFPGALPASDRSALAAVGRISLAR